MPKAVPIITNFTAGELSPRLNARVDIAKYPNGCRQCQNFFVHPHGGATRRSGLRYVADVKTHSKKVRLVRFVYSTVQAYVLEFGDQYMRVFRNQGQVLSGAAAYEIATPYLEADLFELKFCQSADVLYIAHPDYAPRRLTRTGHTAWTLTAITFGSSVTTPGTPTVTWSGAGPNTDYSYVITAIDSNFFESLASSPGTARGPASTALTSTSYINLTWAPVAGAVEYGIYREKSGIYGRIGRAVGTNYMDIGDVNPDYGDCPPEAKNPFSGASNYPRCAAFYQQRLAWAGTDNKPQTVWLSKTGEPVNLDYSSPPRDADACEFTLDSDQVNVIRWMVPTQVLMMGTSGGEWRISGTSGGGITPTDVEARREGLHGSSNVAPLAVGNVVLYIDRHGKRVRELVYNLDTDGYVSPDLLLLAEHMTRSYTIVDWAWQADPHSIAWAVRSDGVLLGLTYMRDNEVVAWHRHVTQGEVESVCVIPGDDRDEVWVSVKRTINGSTKRFVELLEAEFDPAGVASGEDETVDAFFLDAGLTYNNPITMTAASTSSHVKVTCSGTHSLSAGDRVQIVGVEGMTELNGNEYKVASSPGTAWFKLNDLTGSAVNGSAYSPYTAGGEVRKRVSSLSGCKHLAGETVSVLGDGGVQADTVVASDGTIELAVPAYVVHVGLPYTSILEPMLIEAGAADGTSQARLKAISELSVRVYQTVGLKAGPDEDSLYAMPFRSPSDLLGHPPALTSDDIDLTWSGGWDTKARIVLQQTDPLPATVLAIIPRVHTEGR